MDKLHSFELFFVSWLQSFRSPILDYFFYFLNILDSHYFLFIVVPIVWAYREKIGARLLYAILISSFLNGIFKKFFMQPRPFQIDPSLFMINLTDYGFPSGAAEKSIIYAAFFIKYIKRRWLAIFLGINVIFWLSISRIYLGLHFPSDIVGGWVVGIFIIFIVFIYFSKVERYVRENIWKSSFFIFLIAFLVLALLGMKRGISTAAVFISISFGLILSSKYDIFLGEAKKFSIWLLRIGVIFLGVALMSPLVFFSEGLAYLLFGFWVSFFSKLVLKRIYR